MPRRRRAQDQRQGAPGPASNRINPAGQLRLQYRNCTCCSSCWRSSIVAAARLNIHQNQSSKASVSALSHWHLLFVLMAFSLPFWRSSFTNPPPHFPWLRRPCIAAWTVQFLSAMLQLCLPPTRILTGSNNPMQRGQACYIVAIVAITTITSRSAPKHATWSLLPL